MQNGSLAEAIYIWRAAPHGVARASKRGDRNLQTDWGERCEWKECWKEQNYKDMTAEMEKYEKLEDMHGNIRKEQEYMQYKVL